MTISWGSIGFDGAAPMLRKKEPSGLNRPRICPAHSPHQSKYDRRSCRSEYRLYLIPRLYGGEVTTRSTLSPASRDIPAMQSCQRRSNFVIQTKCRVTARLVQAENCTRRGLLVESTG